MQGIQIEPAVLITRTLELLNMEHHAEIEENLNNRSNISQRELEKEGLLISKLCVQSVKTGLFGRTLVKLHKEFTDLPPHKLSPGDLIGIFVSDIKNPEFQGTVYKLSPNYIQVACDLFSDLQSKCSIVILANEVTYKKQIEIMQRLGSLNSKETAFDLAEVLLGNSPARFSMKELPIEFLNKDLNEFQRKSVGFVLDQCQDFGVIHGPPGTGKTTTVVEVILQAVHRNMRVLACAPSNIAVDNLVEKLAGYSRVVRIGHPARMLNSIIQYSFDNLLKKTDSYAISQDIRKELNEADKSRNNRNEVKALRNELKQRDMKAATEVFDNSQVVLSTCISASNKALGEFAQKIQGFDLVVIDEAAQGLECACWVPILLGKKLILAGDHKQLPPTIISEVAARKGLQISLMERMTSIYPQCSFLLEIQYRMHQSIMNWSNDEFYEGRLIAADSVKAQVIEAYPHPLVLIDTSGGNIIEGGDLSKFNLGEAEIIKNFCKELQINGIKDIAVIAPYNAQVEILRNLIESVEVSTVDGFQGREKQVVIISMVRCNERKEVGFLSDFRRLNVAITRAKMLVCIVMDCDTVGCSRAPKFLQRLCKYFQDNAHCVNFQEYFSGGVELKSIKNFTPKEKLVKPKEKKENNENTKNLPVEKKLEVIDNLKKTKEQIAELLRSDDQELKTEKLNAKERHEIHEFCQKSQLYHKTLGSGKTKRMLISKIFPKKEAGSESQFKIDEDDQEVQEIEEEEKKDYGVSTKIEKKKKFPADYDEDEFLNQAMNDSAVCMKSGCQKDIRLIKVVCKFCFGGYCYQHGLAEAHGCGDRAHEAARAQGTRPIKIQDEKLSALKNRLKDKINSLDNRKPKPKKKKK